MPAVVDHLHSKIPVDQIKTGVEQDALGILKSLPGFKGMELIEKADDRGIIVLFWDSAADAQNGANTIGPGWFAASIAPHLASEQQRSVGPVLVHDAT